MSGDAPPGAVVRRNRAVVPTVVGLVLFALPTVWFGLRTGPPPPLYAAVLPLVAVVALGSAFYAWIMHRYGSPGLRPPPAWRQAVALSRVLSFWYTAASPVLLPLSLFVAPVLCLVLLAVLVLNALGTYLVRERSMKGVVLKLIGLVPVAIGGALPLVGRPGGGWVVGDSWISLWCWAMLDLGVLLTGAALAARRHDRR
ncbi:hypothetical protein [Streptantibioticus silvisoli]|uniref:Uncharacterized protein n=1 Tax=Streptantibioticus silvisoli TaxID=2705255 RepID=A0ABT6W212_9ACTN|nr:hypothetical protein [Streptantibioticus silvisoli]MDI5964007.1 hypothetical protein [Streptantibioticus silvisoli]